ncbi:MAG: SusC/RagA family TonB-linked outer membrane protein, partial [Bacteroidales bacterium]
TIVLENTTQGVISDQHGNFTIEAPMGSVLQISFVGYKTQAIKVQSGHINVLLQPELSELSEVVVVGYGEQKKVNLTSAVSSIKSTEITTTRNENVQNMLTGKVAGLHVVQSSSEPGSYDTSMEIRGMGSPLVIVDGIPRDNFARISPDDIESISVLKDASAAVYGVRAANGVILVTTKRGKAGKMSFNYNGSYTMQVTTSVPSGTDAIGYMSLYNEQQLRNTYGLSTIYTDEQFQEFLKGEKSSTNWYEETFKRVAPQTEHSVSLQGGADKISYYFSAGYLNQKSNFKTDDIKYERYNLRSNVSAELLEGMRVGMNLSGTMDDKNMFAENSWWILRSMWYLKPWLEPYVNGNIDYPSYVEQGLNPVAQSNADLNGYNNQVNRWFQSAITLDYEVPFVPGLKLNGVFSYDYRASLNKNFSKAYTLYSDDDNDGTHASHLMKSPSTIYRSFHEYPETLARFKVDYVRSFAKVHNLSVTALYEQNTRTADNFYGRRELSIPIDQLLAGNAEDQEAYMSADQLYQYNNAAIVGRLAYNYKAKYFAEFSFRQDGSSRFSSDNQWGFFPSVSGAWRISEEPFWKNSASLSFVQNLKLRGSWGKTGDDSASSYQFVSGFTYPASGDKMRTPGGYVFGDSFISSTTNNGLVNPNISWYTSEMLDFGIDIELWKGKLAITADYFRRNRDGLLATRGLSLPEEVGSSLPQENLNGDRTSGFDLEIAHKNTIENFSYVVRGTLGYSRSKNKYIERAESGNSYLNWRENTSNRWNDIYWGYGANGRFENYGDILNSDIYTGQQTVVGDYRYEDYNGDGVIDGNDQYPIVNAGRPLFQYGLSLGGKWKDFDFNLLFQGAGKTSVSFTEQLINPTWAGGNPVDIFLDRYHTLIPNADPYAEDTEWVSGQYAYTGLNAIENSMHNVQNAAYFRLKSVEIGYTINKYLRVFANGYNIFTISKMKFVDPERPSRNYGYSYPINSTFSFGVNLKL